MPKLTDLFKIIETKHEWFNTISTHCRGNKTPIWIAEQYSLMFAPFPYEISGHKIYVHINAPLCIKLKIYDLFY